LLQDVRVELKLSHGLSRKDGPCRVQDLPIVFLNLMNYERLEDSLNRNLEWIDVQKLAMSANKALHVLIRRHAIFVTRESALCAFEKCLLNGKGLITNTEQLFSGSARCKRTRKYLGFVIKIANLIVLAL